MSSLSIPELLQSTPISYAMKLSFLLFGGAAALAPQPVKRVPASDAPHKKRRKKLARNNLCARSAGSTAARP